MEEEQQDPLSPENAPGISLIVQLRIYDALMAVLHELNSEKHRALLQAHTEGLMLGPVPSFLGRFLTDESNP